MDSRQATQLTTGAIIIVVGLLLLAGQLDSNWHFGRLWPLILIAMGAGKYLSTKADGSRGDGAWLLFLGGIFLLHTFRIFTLGNSWPLFVVFGGLMLMLGQDEKAAARKMKERSSHGADEKRM